MSVQNQTLIKSNVGLLFAFFTLVVLLPVYASAQSYWVMPRESQYAQALQRVGVTEITIAYHRPMVKGRAIWGCQTTDVIQRPGANYPCLVPNGQVWRAGANDATTITFSTDVIIEGQKLAAGTYGLFMIPGVTEWTIIFNKVSKQWGAFAYDEKQDALRVKVAPKTGDMMEALKYDFPVVTEDSTLVELQWEKLKVAFNVTIDTANQTRAKTRSIFSPTTGLWAAGYWLEQAKNPEEALKWINAAIALEETSSNLSYKANILAAMKRYDEAIQTAERALTYAAKIQNAEQAARVKANLEKRISEWKTQK